MPSESHRNSVVVTAASREYFVRVTNLVGSMRMHNPALPVIVFDIGMTADQLAALSQAGVAVERFEAGIEAGHGKLGDGWSKSSYSFKPLIVEAVASRADIVLWVDSSFEARSPITPLLHFLSITPLLLMTSRWPFPNPFAHPDTLAYFGLSQDDLLLDDGLPLLEVATGIVGFNLRTTGEPGCSVLRPN